MDCIRPISCSLLSPKFGNKLDPIDSMKCEMAAEHKSFSYLTGSTDFEGFEGRKEELSCQDNEKG